MTGWINSIGMVLLLLSSFVADVRGPQDKKNAPNPPAPPGGGHMTRILDGPIVGADQPWIVQFPAELRLSARRANDGDDWTIEQFLDFDSDLTPDAVVEMQKSTGPLSTYMVHRRLRAVGKTRFLRDGAPLDKKTELRVADIVDTVDRTPLFLNMVSLRVELKPDEANSGPWWGRRRAALGVLLSDGEDVRWGYVELTVDAIGKISVDAEHLKRLKAPDISVR